MTYFTKDLRKALTQIKPSEWALMQLLCVLAMVAIPLDSYAQFAGGGLNLSFVDNIACKVITWMKGPLAVMIFVIICVATLVIGMISKMDWSRIISVCVIFGIVVSIGSIVAGSNMVSGSTFMATCPLAAF